MVPPPLARLASIAIVVSATAAGSVPASAAPLQALPETVRVNIAGLGTVSARIGAIGSVTAAMPDGRVLYRGGATVVARTNVWRFRDGPQIPDRSTPAVEAEDAEQRASRLALLREARIAERELGQRALTVVPFEVSVLSIANPIGEIALHAQEVTGIRFRTDDGLLTYNGAPFRGVLEIALDDAGDMIVVNTVRTFDYLASVVGAEVPTTWHPEALAAQAIAARTYLLTHLRRHAAYDLEGDVRDQAYTGLAGETAATVRAVERTAGIVATYRGAPIEALYSANAGGVTEDSENVYANALPYLRSVPSPWDVEATNSSWGKTSWEWTREITAPQLGEQLRLRGVDVGEPERIELARFSSSGRVLLARVVGTKRTEDIGKDRSRWYFGLRSSLYKVDVRPGGELESVHYLDADRIRTLEGVGARQVDTAYRIVWDEDHEHATLYVSSLIYEKPARFVFSGRGFGHGVGMSQWGMQGMALQGSSAEQILKHYYRGIALTTVGGA
jgi:stage II sporulation protein D